MRSTMMDFPLTVGRIFEHGRTTYADSVVVTSEVDGVRRIEFGGLAERADQLAAGLSRLGIEPGDRVATFGWNTQEHQEAYFAVPGMGAVLHTINIRLSAEQIRYIIGHAGDSVILADASLAPVLAPVLAAGGDELETVRHLVVYGDGDRSALPAHVDYEELLAVERPGFRWPEIEETAAAAMCYTSGTTDRPKGVVYSHRSTFLHSLGVCSGEALGLSQYDRVLPVVPMFHGNAWGLPYAAWLVGADLLLPNRFTQAAPLARLITAERATLAAAVPTVWYDVLGLDPGSVDLTSLRMIMCGGAAVPRSLIEAYDRRFGVRVVQGWGLTETSPVASLSFPPKNAPADRAMVYQATAGRPLGGVEARVVDDQGRVLPRDGQATGEIEVRGPWVAAAYYRDPAPDKFRDGWLRTGDVGRIDAKGYVTISDRAKDVIKSGGEWISTLELESAILTHPAVREAAVIAAPDERWGERPLACIARSPGESVTPEELRAHLSGRVAKWWLPERWVFVDEVPRTSVGKHDKKLLRARYAEGGLHVVISGVAASRAADASQAAESEPAGASPAGRQPPTEPSAGAPAMSAELLGECVMSEVVIAAIGRTPIGRAVKGSLIDQRPDDLGAYVVDQVLRQVPQLDRGQVDDVICGCALPGGEQGHNLGRIISILAGIGAPGTTVNRYCSSSLQAVRMAFHAIKADEGSAFVCAGVESSTRSPLGVFADQPETQNSRLFPGNGEGLPAAYMSMGETAENVADKYDITREEMDRYALQSHMRAILAEKDGIFAREIIPVPLLSGLTMTADDGPRPDTTLEKLATLRPVFRKDGRVTAGNSCPLNDGAAAAVVMSRALAEQLGIKPLARIVSSGVSSLEPELMGLGPIESTRQALDRAKMTIDDVDAVEINEAFAAQVIPSARGIGVDPFSDRLNPHGGAIALGHPFGMTGVRILATLLNDLRTRDQTIGLETMCVGGGQGMAMIVERLS